MNTERPREPEPQQKLEKALEQAGPVLEQTQREKTEEALSPEITEMIMEKVKDINADGTAFTSLRDRLRGADKNRSVKYLEHILREGLLGIEELEEIKAFHQRYPEYVTREGTVDKSKWMQTIRSQSKNKKQAPIFFNIMGRSTKAGKEPLKLLNESHYTTDRITLLFDLSKFQEVAPLYSEKAPTEGWKQDTPQQPYTFFVTERDENLMAVKTYLKRLGLAEEQLVAALQPGSDELKELYENSSGSLRGKDESQKGYLTLKTDRGQFVGHYKCLNEKGEILPSDEWGFTLPFRLSPRLFRGLVISEGQDLLEISSTLLKTSKDNPNLIPIYDTNGSLLWPKQMNYEEVKKFAQERDKNKKEKNGI